MITRMGLTIKAPDLLGDFRRRIPWFLTMDT